MGQLKKVLVIDDSPFIYKAVKRAVEPEGFQVIGNAPNGRVGLQMVEKYQPDVITLDITMPLMDGIETAKALFEKEPKAKVVMLSAMGDEKLIDEAKSIGVRCFLSKPFKSKDLLAAVNSLLDEN